MTPRTAAAWLLACCFAATAMLSWVVSAPVVAPRTLGQDYWASRIAECVDGPMTAEQTRFDEACILAAWHDAYDSGHMNEHNRAMLRQQQVTPFISGTCHGLGHSIGTQYVRQGRPLGELLATQQEPPFSCNVGFLHGIMDGLAVSDPTEDQLRAVFAACQVMTPPNRPDCVDGAGHAAYQATHDDMESVRMCLWYDQEIDQVSCVGGIVMQMFRPESDGSRPPDFANQQAHEVMPGVCRSWRPFGRHLEVMCYRTAQLPMSHEADDATRRYRQDLSRSGTPPDPAAVARLARMWSESLERCRLLGDPEGTAQCRDRGAKSVKFAAQVDDLVQAICGRLDQDLQATCRSTPFG